MPAAEPLAEYAYVAMSADKVRRSGAVVAATRVDAIKAVERLGLFPLSITRNRVVTQPPLHRSPAAPPSKGGPGSEIQTPSPRDAGKALHGGRATTPIDVRKSRRVQHCPQCGSASVKRTNKIAFVLSLVAWIFWTGGPLDRVFFLLLLQAMPLTEMMVETLKSIGVVLLIYMVCKTWPRRNRCNACGHRWKNTEPSVPLPVDPSIPAAASHLAIAPPRSSSPPPRISIAPAAVHPLQPRVIPEPPLPPMEVNRNLDDDGNARCSDNDCPCGFPGELLRPGEGYMYVSPAVAAFRKDCPTTAEAIEKARRIEASGQTVDRAALLPVLMCELGARNRGLDLKVAGADARHWWQTGMVPIRATPLH